MLNKQKFNSKLYYAYIIYITTAVMKKLAAFITSKKHKLNIQILR